MITITIQQADFDPGHELQRLQQDQRAGALASFLGLVRGESSGEAVATLHLQHYPGMTERAIEEIAAQAVARWPLFAVRVIHRVGTLNPGARIVLVAVTAAHRGDAFAACEFIMDYLKSRAPFWKREQTPDGPRWVEARESDSAAAARWGEGGYNASPNDSGQSRSA